MRLFGLVSVVFNCEREVADCRAFDSSFYLTKKCNFYEDLFYNFKIINYYYLSSHLYFVYFLVQNSQMFTKQLNETAIIFILNVVNIFAL